MEQYSSNCLARLCVDLDKFERKKLEKREEEKERKELKDLEVFKAKDRRPKRVRLEEQALLQRDPDWNKF